LRGRVRGPEPGESPGRRITGRYPSKEGRAVMRTATGLTLVAIGAILAFAVKGHPWFLNIQIVGWIIILTGITGMVIPRRGYGWLRRRMVLRRGPPGRPVVHHIEEKQYPPSGAPNPGPAIPGPPGPT